MRISGKTKVFTIISHPATHVIAPIIYNHIFERLDLDMVYVAHDVALKAVGHTMQAYTAWENLGGFNVTIPHKEVVVEFLDAMCPITSHTGVVNTVVRKEDGTLYGYNTDGVGALHALGDVKGVKCLMIGAGGAARAILDAIAHGGAEKVYILNRSKLRAERVMDIFPEGKVQWFKDEFLPEVDIVIQATSIADVIPFGLDLSRLKKEARVFEVVMQDTAFSKEARRMGLQVISGFAMLYHQTRRNFKLFTGIDIADDIIRDAFSLTGYRL